MKEHPIIFNTDNVKAILDSRKTKTRRVIKDTQRYSSKNECISKCPYGQVGDRLWVKETHYRYGHWQLTGNLTKTGKTEREFVVINNSIRYYNNSPKKFRVRPSEITTWYKRPLIFMPRWASRINLEITGIRVERLKDITEEDAIAEECSPDKEPYDIIKSFNTSPSAKGHFIKLWDSLNAKRGYGWDTNCWVWVIEFRKL